MLLPPRGSYVRTLSSGSGARRQLQFFASKIACVLESLLRSKFDTIGEAEIPDQLVAGAIDRVAGSSALPSANARLAGDRGARLARHLAQHDREVAGHPLLAWIGMLAAGPAEQDAIVVIRLVLHRPNAMSLRPEQPV